MKPRAAIMTSEKPEKLDFDLLLSAGEFEERRLRMTSGETNDVTNKVQ